MMFNRLTAASIPWHFHGNNYGHKIILLSPDLSTMGNFRFQGDSTSLIMEGTLKPGFS